MNAPKEAERFRLPVVSAGTSYQHEYGSAGGTETAIDLDTDLMRLATGGTAG